MTSKYMQRKYTLRSRENNRLLRTVNDSISKPNVITTAERSSLHRQRKKEPNIEAKALIITQTCIAANMPFTSAKELSASNSLLEEKSYEEFSIENIIKRENDTSTLNETHTELQIKSEEPYHHEDVTEENAENAFDEPFNSIEVDVKQETILPTDKELPCSMLMTFETQDESDGEELILPTTKCDIEMNEKIKCESTHVELNMYSYPSYEDSMNSDDAAALTHVEACLDDEIAMKYENEEQYEEHDKEDLNSIIKQESDLMVTETHLISNKVINTTSTVTNTRDGLIESQTTKTLVMEIHPIGQDDGYNKMSNPEQILPTCNEFDEEYDESFQLNSITGNVLSLEQEAYGLLQAKKKVLPKKPHVCPKCPKAYKTKKGLLRHINVHNIIDKRTLGFIKGVKTRKANRIKKLKAENDDDDDYYMDETRDYKTLDIKIADIKKVENVKKEGYECTCGNTFQRRSRMETCLRSHNLFCDTNSYPCMTCKKQFKSKEELTLHRQRLHKKRFPCKFCPTDYLTRKQLFKHLQVHQKVQLMEYKVISEVMKGRQKLKCFMCPKTCTELSELKCHVMDDHKEPYSCPHCKRTFPKIIDFGNHMKTYHPNVQGQSVLNVLEAFCKLVKAWKCEECGLQFHEADKLAMHQLEKHSPVVKIESQFQCTDCRRVFLSQKSLTSHRRVHHSIEAEVVTEPVDIGVMCLECRKMCKDMNALTSHMRLHSMDRKFPCKFCDYRFATAEKRKAHAEIHTGDMKFVCFICEYQCSSAKRLKQHKMSLKHLNMKEFLLTGKPLIQEEQSTSKQKIKDTLRKKEWGVKKRKKDDANRDSDASDSSEVPCDICGDKFPSESVMVEHKQTHPFIEFPNDDKPSRIFFK